MIIRLNIKTLKRIIGKFQNLLLSDLLHLVARKANDDEEDSVHSNQNAVSKKKKNSIKNDTQQILSSVNIFSLLYQILDLKNKIDNLEGRNNILEICQNELAMRNIKIKHQLQSLNEKEKSLENLLIMALKNFSPAFSVKSDIKYLDGKPSEANNQIIEVIYTIY